ncbi:MAG: acyltransferase [Bacteroidales bacterium]|nr:acyltransferase [Bacteroidales bacterium]
MIKTRRMYFANLLIAVLPNSGCQKFKSRLWRWAGVKVGEGVEIFQGVKIHGVGEMEVGNNVFIGHDVIFMINVEGDEVSKVILEDESIVGTRSIVITGFHDVTPDGVRVLSRNGTCSTVRIGRGCSVSTNCTVLPGVTVGEMALVAAGATITKDVEPYAMVGGCPAKFIRSLKA